MEIVILAGGQAKRLRPLTDNAPKCMIPINGKPMIQYHLDFLKKYPAVDKVILACGYMWEEIKKHYGNAFIYSVEDEPRGTAGAIKLALDHVEGDEFLALNADDINNADLNRLLGIGANTVCISRFNSQFGIVETEGDLITEFRQKPLLPFWANMGLYLLSKNLNYPEKGAIETDVLPQLAKKGQLKAYRHTGYWVTINTVKELEEAGEMLKKLGL